MAIRPIASRSPSSHQWGATRAIQGGDLVTQPPLAVIPMRTTHDVPSLDEFPMRRDNHPNYKRLTKCYYRLYRRSGEPLRSLQSHHADDPSVSEFALEHVPPPSSMRSVKRYICTREDIHPSRVRLFIPGGADGLDEPARLREAIPLNRGNDEIWALRVEVAISPRETRKDAVRPASFIDRMGNSCELCCEALDSCCRGVGNGFGTGCLYVFDCLVECFDASLAGLYYACCYAAGGVDTSRSQLPSCFDGMGCHYGETGTFAWLVYGFVNIIMIPFWILVSISRWTCHFICGCYWYDSCCDLLIPTYRQTAMDDCVNQCYCGDPFGAELV